MSSIVTLPHYFEQCDTLPCLIADCKYNTLCPCKDWNCLQNISCSLKNDLTLFVFAYTVHILSRIFVHYLAKAFLLGSLLPLLSSLCWDTTRTFYCFTASLLLYCISTALLHLYCFTASLLLYCFTALLHCTALYCSL